MFRNLRLYRLTSAWPASEDELSSALETGAFRPCSAVAERSIGWEAPAEDLPGVLARRVGGADLMRLRHQARVLPPAAIREALDERLEEFRRRTGAAPTAREKRELKEEITTRLLPQALLKSDRIHGFYLASEKLLGVDTATDTTAERFLDRLRADLGSLKAVPLSFARPTSELLERIFLGRGPSEFGLGRECRMRDPSVPGAYAAWMHVDLAEPSVRKHVREGFKLDRLAIEFDGCLACVLDDDTVLRKVRLLGVDAEESADEDDALARQDADFALLTGTLRRLVRALRKALAT